MVFGHGEEEAYPCIITSVGVDVSNDNALQSTVEFITTGPFDLRYKFVPSYLLVDGITRDIPDEALRLETDDPIELFRSEFD